jgi:hypothetical protein
MHMFLSTVNALPLGVRSAARDVEGWVINKVVRILNISCMSFGTIALCMKGECSDNCMHGSAA